MKPFGTWRGGIGENLTYGDESARERVLLWLIDDGFASRGHRTRLLSGDYKVAGVACAVHPEFSKMCVLDLAGGFVDSLAVRPAGNTETKSTGVASKTNTPAKAATGSTTRTNKSRTTSKPRYRKV